MESTRDKILQLGESLIRRKGYNAFSYLDISRPLEIKNAAVHYYFPRKSDLAIAIFKAAQCRFDEMWEKNSTGTAKSKLLAFIQVYGDSAEQDMVCLVGAMAAEYYSLDEPVQEELKLVVGDIEQRLTRILSEGKTNGEFRFPEEPGTRALMVITNLLAGLQLARLNGRQSFERIKDSVIASVS